MLPYKLLDTTPIPGDGGELRLFEVGDRYVIRLTGAQGELMSTRAHASEDALAERTCQRVAARLGACVLIGGLGMGFTLAAALRNLGPDATVVTAELVPGVVRWNREVFGDRAGHPLRDERSSVKEVDVAALLRAETDAYDAILLDVDNGPTAVTHPGNAWLYSPAGLAACFKALRPRGVLGVWSAGPDERFKERLGRAGFDVEEHRVHAHGRRGAQHVVYCAGRP
ncbi:MAG: hypothetical protein EXR76_14395 [Myxococcales bacterium]|nr:hypothetical protein [Myxococcales bacterium]